jgi:aspartyl-tRNA(Asn)/glutamyl-tRNA(Gln) amidotransferase subunit A
VSHEPHRPRTRSGGAGELFELTAGQALGRIEAGELGSDEYFDAYAEAAAGDELNAYLWRAEPGSRAAGGEGFRGLPIAIKDIFCTEGIPTTAGSRILEGYRPPYTATAVARLADAGARVLGKTNMDEFAMGSSNENSGYGPVLNPWDRSRVPGGSSGGSAAAVAARLAPWAIGTDTGGSIRQPASLCGIVGMKPTYGAISRYGMIAFASSLDQCGPLTRDVTDAAMLVRAMQGRDHCDSTSVGIEGGVELPSREDLRGLRFGIPRELAGDAEGIETGVSENFEATLRLIEELGGELDQCELPSTRNGISAYYVIAPAEASANLARYDGVRYGMRDPEPEDLLGMYERTRARGFGAEVKRRIMLGTYALSSGYYEAYYGQAQKVRTRIAQDFDAAFARFDFLVTPTSPTVAFELGAKTADPWAMYMNDYCTVPMPLAGIPAISIPSGLAAPAGGGPELPVGFQITGPAFSESGILDAAYALERAIGFTERPAA